MPATLLSRAPFASPALQERATASPMSKPSTASVKSLMKFRRRNSPSVKISRPSSFCFARTQSISRSSISRRRFGFSVAFLRASKMSGGRRKLPTWSARYSADILSNLLRIHFVVGQTSVTFQDESSDPELFVYFQAMLTAIRHVVVDEPKYIQSLQ